MKRKISTALVAIMMIVGLSLSTTSCTTDSGIEETQWRVVNIRIDRNDWQWDNNAGQYQVIVDLPELTPFIFNEGFVSAYVKFNNNTKASLPYIKSYYFDFEEGGEIYYGTYTETIKCDFQVGNPSTVAFYIEASDLERVDEYLETKDFQVVLIW